MDLEAVRVFVRVAELGSFTRASEQLGVSKARASMRVRALEEALDARLLVRTTRAVRLTEDGSRFLARAKRLVRDADELATMFQTPSALRDRVRVDLPTRLARDHVLPRVPEFLAAHPHVELLVSTTDRQVDLVREGFDCVLRVGHLPESNLVVRRLGALSMANCASPGYVSAHGLPHTIDDLERHWLVGYSPTLAGTPQTFEYRDGGRYRELPMRTLVTVNGTDAYYAACVAGLGIVQIPRLGAAAGLASGTILELLPEAPSEPMPVSIVLTHRRPRRPVRALIEWLTRVVVPLLG